MLIDETIRMKISINQKIDIEQLKILYRMGSSIMKLYRELPLFLDVGREIELSEEAVLLYERIDQKINLNPLIIITG